MNLHAELALAKQAFDQLLALCEPEQIADWHASPAQRDQYLHLVDAVLTGYERLVWVERQRLHEDTQIHSVVPESQLTFLRDQLKPRLASIRAAADHLDPEGKLLRDSLFEAYAGNHSAEAPYVRWGINESLVALQQLLDSNPEFDDGHDFALLRISEFMDSRLVQFEPDAWLERAQQLTPIRSGRTNFSLPGQVRIRLQELYRAHVFGLWLSVLALSRSILEYAILDNAAKFQIDPKWPPDRYGQRRDKKLSHLIDELAPHLPGHMQSMEILRELGNDYIHPAKSDASKALMFRTETNAKRALELLVDVVETIYMSPGPQTQATPRTT